MARVTFELKGLTSALLAIGVLAASCGGGAGTAKWPAAQEDAFVASCVAEKEVPPPTENLCRCELTKIEELYKDKATWEASGDFTASLKAYTDCEGQ